MFDRLEELVDKLDTINNQLTDPDVVSDQNKFRKLMKEQMTAMKNINIIEDVVTVKSVLKAADEAKLEELADKLMD